MKNFTILFLLLAFANILNAQEREQINGPERHFYQLAEKNRANGRYQTAISEYESAILINDQEKEFYIGLGLCYAATGKLKLATKNFEESLALDSSCERSYHYLFKSYQGLQMKEKLIQVLDLWSQNASSTELRLEKKIKIIDLLVSESKFSDALEHTYDALDIAPDSVEVLNWHALVNNELGNYEEAVVSAQKAVTLLESASEPQKNEAFYQLGYAQHYLGEYQEQKLAFQNVSSEKYKRKMFKLSPAYYTNLATIYFQLFEYKIAKHLLNDALKIDKYFVPANKLAAQIQKVAPSENPGIEAHKEEVIALYENGIKGIQNKLAAGEESNQLMKELYRDYTTLIRLKIATESYEEALAKADEALAVFDAPLYSHKLNFLKAMVYHKKEDNANALQTIETALNTQLLPKEYRSKYEFMVAHIYHLSNDLNIAKQHYAKALNGNYAIAADFGLVNIHDFEASYDLMIKKGEIPLAQMNE